MCINVRLPFVQCLDEILDIKLGLAYKEKQANLSEVSSPFLLHDSVAIMKSHYYFSRYLCQVNPLESLNIRAGSRVFRDFSNVVP